jgi:heme exporter protein B
MGKILSVILKRDFSLAFIRKGYFFNSLALFILSVLLLIFILLSGQPVTGVNVLNIILLPYIFAELLSAPEIFQEDFNDSSLEQLIIAGYPSFYIVISKMFAHWLQLFIILCISVPILCFIYNIHLFTNLFSIYLVLLLFSITVSALVTFASALTLRISNGVIVNCLIVMPLAINLLLYTASILNMIAAQVNYQMLFIDIQILFAISLSISTIVILACSYILTKI